MSFMVTAFLERYGALLTYAHKRPNMSGGWRYSTYDLTAFEPLLFFAIKMIFPPKTTVAICLNRVQKPNDSSEEQRCNEASG